METDNPYKCDLLKEDYIECLHHRKEVCLGGNGCAPVERPFEYSRSGNTETGEDPGEKGERGVQS